MKKLIAVVAIAMSLTSCGSGSSDTSSQSTATSADSVKKASDSVMQTGDTSALNGPMGNSTSLSHIQGKDSGSKVGGGDTGGRQGRKVK